MVVQNLLLATEKGLGDGSTPVYPVQIFKVKNGVNAHPGDPNYDLFRQAMQVSGLRLYPEFQFPGCSPLTCLITVLMITAAK